MNSVKTLCFIALLALVSLPSITLAEETNAPSGEPLYYELSPPFVVNLVSGQRMRFLQVRMQVFTYGKENVEAVKLHNAPIRDAIITLLTQQSRDDLNTAQKKEALRTKVLERVQKVLTELNGKPTVDSLYFTSFVVQ